MKNSLTTAQRVAKMLLEIKAVTLSPQNPYRFVSGILSPIYTDNRLLMGYPLKRKEITIYMANLIKEKGLEPQIIAGTATAGIPPATWLAELLNLPMIYVRGEKKNYGKGNQVEGLLPKKASVLLIEDVISTGKSSLSAVDAVRKEGGKVNTCLAFFSYGLSDSEKAYKNKRVELYTLTSLSVLVDMAQKMGLIAPKEKSIILLWQKDPWGWEEKMKRLQKPERKVEY